MVNNENFEFFIYLLKDRWETELLSPRSEIKKRHYEYEVFPNQKKVCIYLFSRKSMVARFEPERCWMDDGKLSSILREIMPEFCPYFQGQKNLTTDKWEFESE